MTTPEAATSAVTVDRHLTSTLVTTIAVPLAIITAGTALALSWRDALPDPIATHWSADGVDGVGSLGATVGLVVAIVTVFTAAMAALGIWWGRAALTRRLAAGVAVWFSAVQTGVLLGILTGQRGLMDPYQAPGSGGSIAVTFAAATEAAVVVGFLVPGDPARPAAEAIPTDAPRLRVTATERAIWVRRTTQQHVGTTAAVVAAFSLTMGTLTQMWWLSGVLVVGLALILLGALRWTVTVDATGLSVRSVVGLRVHVPLDEVEGAAVTHVAPIRQFGGWGLRVGVRGATGVITRKGEAIDVTRTGHRRTVVTVDDAATGAALLNTLADRARRRAT